MAVIQGESDPVVAEIGEYRDRISQPVVRETVGSEAET
jgi:hypothetical protein